MSSTSPIFIVRLRGNGLNDIHELRRILKILLRADAGRFLRLAGRAGGHQE
jgi:hypothetical protein